LAEGYALAAIPEEEVRLASQKERPHAPRLQLDMAHS
jgi:hypothetical protein